MRKDIYVVAGSSINSAYWALNNTKISMGGSSCLGYANGNVNYSHNTSNRCYYDTNINVYIHYTLS